MDFSSIQQEIAFKTSRSSGAGGQHVNKVSSRVSVFFQLQQSKGLSDVEKNILTQRLSNKLTKEGTLILHCETSRSQHKNKEEVIVKLRTLLVTSLKKTKKRIPTKISKSAVRKRLKNKKIHAKKKTSRKKPNADS